MYIPIFVFSLLAVISLAVLYMFVAYNLESLRRCCRRKPPCATCRQENDVWNISGRVNSQSMENWPTHDHHISIDSFAFPPDYQAKDPRFAPPPYTEVDLPTYEEAMTACANGANNKVTNQPPLVPVHGATTAAAGATMIRSETA